MYLVRSGVIRLIWLVGRAEHAEAVRSRDGDDEVRDVPCTFDSLGDADLSKTWPNADIFEESARAERVEYATHKGDDAVLLQARNHALDVRWLDAEGGGGLDDGVTGRPVQVGRKPCGKSEQLMMPARINWGDGSQALFWQGLFRLRARRVEWRGRWGLCSFIWALQFRLVGGIIQ